jgi:hypothetical protein
MSYCVTFETPQIWRVGSLLTYPLVTRQPSYAPNHSLTDSNDTPYNILALTAWKTPFLCGTTTDMLVSVGVIAIEPLPSNDRCLVLELHSTLWVF